ncbi:hypothetical protein C8R42DRAFT_630158 [Lentinula raphanica]|nr:hypothetical protein C8R42DRAFT_630158 [Lentinula raphanica]
MTGQCSICLSDWKDPVCIPCGHLYCSPCLLDYIASSSEDGYTTICPTCRAVFPIVSPELTCLPKHVHRYITPSIRRVYLDNTAVQSLQQKLATSQNQVKNLQKESERLMLFCEKYQNAAEVHADGEAKARLEIERLTRLLRESRVATAEAAEQASEWRERHGELKKQVEGASKNHSRKRASTSQLTDDSLSTSTPMTPRRRIIRDLPMRNKKKLKRAEPDSQNVHYSRFLVLSDSE